MPTFVKIMGSVCVTRDDAALLMCFVMDAWGPCDSSLDILVTPKAIITEDLAGGWGGLPGWML